MIFSSCISRYRKATLFIIPFTCLLIFGCGTMSTGRRWGEDATLEPGWAKVGESVLNAVTSPMFYIPAAGALLFQIDHADKRLSDWAMEHTPVYGSMENADKRSGDISTIANYALYLSMLATPGGKDPLDWGTSKAKGVLTQEAALGLNHLLVSQLKDSTNRERPNGDNDQSFPSSTTANTAAYTTLTSRNIDTMDISRPAKIALNTGLYTMLGAVAWGRVEAGCHYPSDVLAGISQAYFISSVINDSFMGLDSKSKGGPMVGFNGSSLFVGYYRKF
jgi:hypothetical protein